MDRPVQQKVNAEGIAFLLMHKLLSTIKDSGANQREATSALKAALAMVPEMGLEVAPTMVIEA